MHLKWIWEQRALQDWYVKFALQTVSGVAEVASFGGFEKQSLVVDPLKLQYYNISLMDVMIKCMPTIMMLAEASLR
jgi:Cu(I)/Ag(I) efflux system membrane protein CusA/SilA